MEGKIIKTCLIVIVLCGCIQGSNSSKPLDEKEINHILKKQGGFQYTKLPENKYKYGDAPVVAVVRSNPINIRRDISHHMDPIKAVKRVVSPVCPLPLIKSQIAAPLAKLNNELPLKSVLGDSFIEDENHEGSRKHRSDKNNLNIEASVNLDRHNNLIIDAQVSTNALQDNLSSSGDKRASPTHRSKKKTVFYEEPIAPLKQHKPHLIEKDALTKVTLPIQQVTSVKETPSNTSICSATNNHTNKNATSKTENTLPIDRVETIVSTNNTNTAIYDTKSADIQGETKKPLSLELGESDKSLKPFMVSNLGPQRRMNINNLVTDELKDVTLKENSDVCNTNNILPSNSVNTNTNVQGNNEPCREDNAVENEVQDIVIEDHDVDEVIESYKNPYNMGYNMAYNIGYNTGYNPAYNNPYYNYNACNGLTNGGGMYNRYNPGLCYAQNQGFTQDYTNNIPMQYYNCYEPTAYQYGPIEAKQVYPNIHRPDYTFIPPPFKYPTAEQLLCYNNNMYRANNYNTGSTNNFEIPYCLWSQQDLSKPQDIYDRYGQIPQNWNYNQGYYPNRFVDRILRSWRRTSVTLKPVKNNAKPLLMRLKREGENINKMPLSALDVRKALISGNGCYRNQNTSA